MANRRVMVVGAGGCAREVAWVIREIAGLEFAGFVVSDLSKLGPRDSRDQVLGDLDWLGSHRDRFDGLVLGIGSPAARLAVAGGLERDFAADRWPAVAHPSARFDRDSVQLGPGSVICPNATVTVNVVLEAHAMVHYGCSVGHEARIGRASVINPGANVS